MTALTAKGQPASPMDRTEMVAAARAARLCRDAYSSGDFAALSKVLFGF